MSSDHVLLPVNVLIQRLGVTWEVIILTGIDRGASIT